MFTIEVWFNLSNLVGRRSVGPYSLVMGKLYIEEERRKKELKKLSEIRKEREIERGREGGR